MKKDNLKIIKDICPDSVEKNGSIKSFEKQLLEYEYGVKEYNHPLVINSNSDKLNYAETSEKPLFINKSTINKLKSKHNLDLEFVIDINEKTKNSIFAFDSIQHDSSKIFVMNEKVEDNPIIFVVREDKKAGTYLVNELTSMYDRKNLQNLINRTLEEGGKTYLNPEKINEFKEMGYDIGIDRENLKEKKRTNKKEKEKER